MRQARSAKSKGQWQRRLVAGNQKTKMNFGFLLLLF
jgi:hypothetical protein